MLTKLEPQNLLVGLLALFFALGYLVGRTPAAAPEAIAVMTGDSPVETPPVAVSSAPTTAIPQVATAQPVPVVAPAAVTAAAPAAAPTVAKAAPVAPKPAPVAPKPAPVAPKPAPVAPKPAPAKVETIWRVTVHDDDAQLGVADPVVTVVFFSSFGCPTCAQFKDAPKRLLAKYPGKVRIHWKHKVVPPQHPDALDASIAALAAKRQGEDKFWAFHDRIFQNNAIDAISLENAAKAIGLDVERWRKDRQDPALRQQVLRDSLVANEVGAHSMPNILVNGIRMPKPKTWESLVATVDKALAIAEAKLGAGADKKTLYVALTGAGKFFEQLGVQTPAVDTSDAAKIGPDTAKIKITTFEDFQCPFCAKVGPAFKAFQARYPTQVQVIFKHMPLTSIHDHAMLAAEAAKEAQAQGKFWALHDLLFQNQQALEREDIERYAGQVGMDLAKLKAALDGHTHKAAISRDLSDGGKIGVSGTPTVLLNGRRYQGPRGYPPEGFEAVSVVYLGLSPR